MNEDSSGTSSTEAPQDFLSAAWRRVKEHRVAQWTIAYVAIAYAIQHGVTLTSEALDWPHAFARVTMLLLGFGLPLTMVLAWYHGERASRSVSKVEFSIIALLLAVGALWFYSFVKAPADTSTASTPAVQEAGVTAARRAAADPHTAISVAVLPFANLSDDKQQEFFSDGMTDEISGALAKIPDLRVVGRASAFQYKNRASDLRAIGQALGATHLIEGSVRKAGNRVRISAELVQAENGLRVWSDNYDRELTDVFAIQEDIARAIAASLRMPLGLKPGEQLVSSRTKDLQAYEDVLKARVVGPLARTTPNAGTILQEAVARDPGFAPAWAGLADLYRAASNPETRKPGPVEDIRRAVQSYLDKAENAARQALALDPQYPDGYAELANVEFRRGKWADAERLFLRALAFDSGNPEALHGYGQMLTVTGRLKEGLAVRENLLKLEPFVPIYNSVTAVIMHVNGQDEAAIMLLETAFGPQFQDNYNRAYPLAAAYAAIRQYDKSVDVLLRVRGQVSVEALQDAARLLRTAPKKAADPRQLPELVAELNFVYPHVGAAERSLDYPERVLKIGNLSSGFYMIWDQQNAPIRKSARFKKLVRDAGLADYWKARGWPDLCHPVGADDFECS